MQFVIFGMVMQMYKRGIKLMETHENWIQSTFDYFGAPCRSLYSTNDIDIFEKYFNFLHKASMIECCFNVIVGPIKSKNGKYEYYSSVLPYSCMWDKLYHGDYQKHYDRYIFLQGDSENSQEPLKVIKENTKVSKRKNCTTKFKTSAAPHQKRNRLIK